MFAEHLLCLLGTSCVPGSVWGGRGVSQELLGSSEDRHRPEIAAWDRNIDRVRWPALGAEGGKRTSV